MGNAHLTTPALIRDRLSDVGLPADVDVDTLAVVLHDAATAIARAELASLGAHIESTHNLAADSAGSDDPKYQTHKAVASLGGYMMAHYGQRGNPPSPGS